MRRASTTSHTASISGTEPRDLSQVHRHGRQRIKEQFRPQSEKQLKLRLALEKIAELENLEVSDEAVEEEYEKLAKQYNMEVAQIKNLVAETQIRADLKNQKAIDFVKENASVKAEKPAKKTTRRKSTKKAAERKNRGNS